MILVLAAVGIHSCQVSQRNSALTSYANNVTTLIQNSSATANQFFGVLHSARSSSNSAGGGSVQTQLDEALDGLHGARSQLASARGMNVPDEVKNAHQELLLALQMRVDGISNVAANIQGALSGSRPAVDEIAAEMARLYASDAVYKDYAAPETAAALHAANIAVGGSNGVQIAQQQFVPDIRWLDPSFVASQLQVSLGSSSSGKLAPGTHGHALNSVSVAGTTLQTGSTNIIPAKPPPTFTLNFSNTGQNIETNVVCKVAVSGTGISSTATVAQTTPGETTSCQVTLKSAPPTGSAQVVATIEPVPGETNIANNTLTFPVTFQ